MVVFGNDVLLYSDKNCEIQQDTELKIAWPRGKKRASINSSKQLGGAETFLRRFPDRLFVDSSCQTKLPVALPLPSEARCFLIAVTRDGHEAALSTSVAAAVTN